MERKWESPCQDFSWPRYQCHTLACIFCVAKSISLESWNFTWKQCWLWKTAVSNPIGAFFLCEYGVWCRKILMMHFSINLVNLMNNYFWPSQNLSSYLPHFDPIKLVLFDGEKSTYPIDKCLKGTKSCLHQFCIHSPRCIRKHESLYKVGILRNEGKLTY